MDILPYLATLLKERKAVGLDGFGTLVKTKVPGRFDAQTQSYLPPSYKLSFNTDIAADGELARFISEQRNLSVNTTGYYIGEYVTSLNNAFAETGEVTLPGIGTLSRVDGELHFDTDPALDLGHDFFGLPAVAVAPAAAQEEVTGEQLAEPEDEELAVGSEQLAEKEQLEVDSLQVDAQTGNTQHTTHNAEVEVEEYEEVSGKGYLKWLIIAFILVAVIAGALVARPDLYGKIFGVKPDTSIAAFNKDTLKNKQDTLSADSALKNKIKDILISDTAAMRPAMTADSTLFEIFALSVKTEATARKYMERFNKMGFAAKGFKTKLRINISVASFTSEREAMDSLPAIRKKLKDPKIFVKETKVTEPQITHTTQ